MRFFVLMLPAVYALAGVVQSAAAAETSKEQSAQPTPPAEQAQTDAPTAQAGMRVYVDPATGRRTSNPTAEQRVALSRADEAALGGHERFTTENLPSGAVILRTHGGGQSVVMARVGSDGKVTVGCDDATHRTMGQHDHNRAESPAREEF